MSQDEQKPMRLFLALWPDQAVRDALHDYAKEWLVTQKGWHGRLVDKQNLHITLAFLGAVASDQLDCVRNAAALVRWQAFTLQLDQPGYFDRARVAWLAPSEVPQQLTDMVLQLRPALVECGFAEEQRSINPHVTLARKCRAPRSAESPAPLQQPLIWEVDSLALVASVTDPAGVWYEVIERWGPDELR